MPRYDAEAPFEGAFVQYSDAWSVGQRNQFWEVKGDEFLVLLRAKMESVNLPAIEGDAIVEAEAITEADMNRLDVRLYEWFRGTWLACLLDIGKLGEASRRSLFATYEATNSETKSGE